MKNRWDSRRNSLAGSSGPYFERRNARNCEGSPGFFAVVDPSIFENLTATTAVLALLMAVYVRELRRAHSEHAGLVPLGLRGAERIEVSRTDADTYQWLTSELKSRCPSFFSMPGLFSFYFWTHQAPPTMLMMNDWPAFFNAKQQEAIIGDLKRNSTACIVYNPALVEFLRAGQDLSQSPLANYIQKEFVRTEERNGYYFMVRKE